MQGTTWAARFVANMVALERSFKALPAPAQLYQPQQGISGAGPIAFPGYEKWEREYGQGNNRDLANAKTAVNSTWVFADVQAIAKEFSAAELVVKEKQGDGALEDVDNHALEALWAAPNPHMGRSFLMEYWAWSYTLVGKAYLYWVPVGGKIREVWPVPAFMLAPVPDGKQFIKGYAFKSRPDSDAILIPSEYITYSHSVNPFDIRDGMSFLVAGMDAIRGDIAATKWNVNFFAENNGVPDGLITVKAETLDTDLARIRQEIRDFFGGTRRGVAVARAGDMDYKPFGRTQKEAEFLQGRELASKEIGRLLGFPDGYWSESANRANAEQARATMIAGAVWPLLVRLHEDLNAGIVKRWYGENFRAEFKDIRPENRELKLQEFTAWQAVLTVDELRELIDKDPIGDVRGAMLVAEIAAGAATPTSAPSMETEQILSEMEADAAPEGEDEAPPEEEAAVVEGDAVEEGGAAEEMKRWETKALNTLRKKGRATCVFQSDAIVDAARATIAQGLADARTPQEVRAVFAPFYKADAGLDARLAAILRTAERRAVAAIMAGGDVDLSRLEAELTAALQAELTQAVLAGVTFQGAAFGVALDNASALAAEWAASYVPGTVRGMTETTRAAIEQAITAYRTTNATREQVVAMLAGSFGVERAEMIADTELTRANSQATVAVNTYLRGAGLDYQYKWLTSTDERVCPVCGPRDDTIVEEGDLPPAHPRCRCRSVNVPAGATKHLPGGHDQRSHGRSTARRRASRAAYAQARAGGASIAEARAIAKEAGLARQQERNDRLARMRARALNEVGVTPTALPVRAFDDPAAADAYLRAQFAGVKPSRMEDGSLEYYQGGSFETVNGRLRGTLPYTLEPHEARHVDGHIKRIDDVMARSRTQDNVEVYRGMFVNQRDTAGWEAVARLQPGATFREPSFLSTTVDPYIARQFSQSNSPWANDPGWLSVDVKIRVPAGTSAVYYNAARPKGNPEERELLLGRNLTYRVVRRTDNPGGRTVVELEVMR